MRKLVLKTVLVVLSLIIVVGSIIFGAIALFQPKVIGNISEKVENYPVVCWAYERQYSIDGSGEAFRDCEYAYTRYAFSLIEDEEFEKATDLIVTTKIGGNSLDNVARLVRTKLKSKENEQNRQVLSKCIERLNEII